MKKKTAKRKVARRSVTKKSVARRSSSNTTFLDSIMNKRHRPWHGLALGGLMFLFQSVWGLLALLGGGLMVISALALVLRKTQSKR